MTKYSTLIFALTLLLATLACGSKTPLPTPESASTLDASPMTGQPTAPPEDLATKQAGRTEPREVVPGFRILYLREGNLWVWTEASGIAQLTNSGDISTIRVSGNGQLLAYMRGRDVWTVQMDGKDARLLGTQPIEGGALWFAPSGSLLAVSTGDHIDVIDLATLSAVTVLTYPVIADDYYPEVVWSPDSSGFKTVIPAPTENGQAEMLFVFTNGTVASLAKFVMSPLSESLPYLSPDGGYLIYVAKLGADQESLYLMDSSGATRPYGEPVASVRAYGWLPDAERFVYGWEEPQRTLIGSVGGAPAYNEIVFPQTVRWVASEYYLAVENGDLVLGNLDGARMLIDTSVSGFDFVP